MEPVARATELEKMLRNQRKGKRETLELKELLAKAKSHVKPDPKIIKLIEDEITRLLNGN